MRVRHILAAADESEEGRAAIVAAAALGGSAGARVSVLTVVPPAGDDLEAGRALETLRGIVRSALLQVPSASRVECVVGVGLPGIEIGRFAETARVDLIVIGRKRRSARQRMLIGDTADSVARRSPVPCLFVNGGGYRCSRVLVALDGTERGLGVLLPAMDFTRATGARLRAVSVEPSYDSEHEHDGPRLLTARSSKLLDMVNGRRAGVDLGAGRWEDARGPSGDGPVVIRRGRIIEELLTEISSYAADALVIGYHRGGPAGAIESGSVARRLVHEAPCAVLTVPL